MEKSTHHARNGKPQVATTRLMPLYVGILLLSVNLLAPAELAAQETPLVVEWQFHTASPTLSTGTTYSDVGGVLVPAPHNYSETQTPDDSGHDWWYDLVELKENGIVVGYVAVGNSGSSNWNYQDGCYGGGDLPDPRPQMFETATRRRGDIRGAIARYDLDGNLVWFHSFSEACLQT